MSEAVYLYGFVPEDTPPPEGLSGVGGAPVELVGAEGFGVVIGRVPAAEYAAAAVETRLRDLEWVGVQGLRHEEVVAWFVDHARILPVRLLTLYSSVDAVLRDADRRAAEIRENLDRFAGRREWDLKVVYSVDRLAGGLGRLSASIRALDAEIAEAAPGKRFLLERRRAELARTETAQAVRKLGADVLDAARGVAVELKLLAPPKASVAAVAVNAALLIEAEREAEAKRVVEERAAALAEYGVEVSFSGPWAPYRFLGGDE